MKRNIIYYQLELGKKPPMFKLNAPVIITFALSDDNWSIQSKVIFFFNQLGVANDRPADNVVSCSPEHVC